MPKHLSIATIAMAPNDNTIVNAHRIAQRIKALKEAHPDIDLIVYGEMILCHYVADDDYHKDCAVTMDSQAVQKLRDGCRDSAVNLSIGMVLREEDDIYNAQILLGRSGEILSVHRKCNLTASERQVFTKGDSPVTHCEVEGITVATSVCYDAFHPAFKAAIKAHHPHIFIHSLADPLNPHFATGHNGRQTVGYYISANRYGTEGKTDFCGHIAVVSPWGRIIALRHGREDVIIHRLTINPTPSRLTLLLRSVTCGMRLGFHYVRHWRRVWDYLKWDRRMKSKRA